MYPVILAPHPLPLAPYLYPAVNPAIKSQIWFSWSGGARVTMRKYPSAGSIPKPDPWTHSTPVAWTRSMMKSASVFPWGNSTFGIA